MLRFMITTAFALVFLTCWGDDANSNGAFIFIEKQLPFTSEDGAAKSIVVYLNEKGLAQRYACMDYQIKERQEGSLPVADIFKALSAMSFKILPGPPKPDFSLPDSEAHPGYLRMRLRQHNGEEYMWSGAPDKVPPALQQILQETEELAAKTQLAPPASGIFFRAALLTAAQLAGYRAGNLLKTVKEDRGEVDSALCRAMNNPFLLVSAPAEANKLFAVTHRDTPDQIQVLYKDTGFEVSRYSWNPPSLPQK